MDSKASVVRGGLSIKHQLYEGKHQYEVENSFKFKKENGGGGGFGRKGDKLLMVNGVNLQELTPEEFALLLTKGNPMLTVHQAQKKAPTDHVHSSEDTFKPISKETTQLRFSLEMKREEDLGEEEGCNERGLEGQSEEEEVCLQGGDVENRKEGDFLIVTLRKTSVSVVKGRGPATTIPCHECTGSECAFNDVIMVSDSSSVILVPRGGSGSFKCERQRDISIEHVVTQSYLSSLCLQKRPIVSPNPENITIYYYKSNSTEKTFRGIPVVLNFTDSNCFLKCSKDGERVILCVETCNKHCLRQISRSDASRLSFVFYMKSTRDQQRRFESALCPGWFIHIVTDAVTVQMTPQPDDPAFFFIIR